MSPRRSSRARTTQPPPAAPQHTNSSTSLNSLSRAERSTRSNNKANSPPRSSVQRSQSSEDQDSARGDLPQTRQRKRGRDADNDDTVKTPPDEEENEEGEEEETTRCICGQQEYPGPPVAARDAASRSGVRPGVKDEAGQNTSAAGSENLSDDAGGLFIQCDKCKVWQHGGCVGIMDEAMSPDDYYCEQCRPDYHKIMTGLNGQKYSRYRPVLEKSPPPSSSASSAEVPRKKPSRARLPQETLSTKRRSTMNSRDAAYEEELLLRAIEESKEDTKHIEDDISARRGKRSRSESEERNKQSTKRQRTSPGTPSSGSKRSQSPAEGESGDESNRPTANGNSKRIRGAAARNHREKELREKETDKQRDEPTGRRNGRIERRRAEDSPPSESLSPSKAASQPPASSQPPDTPSSHPEPRPTSHQRKTGRPPARRGRLGRNQYTRDMPNGEPRSNNSPMRDVSRDGADGSPQQNGINGIHGEGGGRSSRPKHLNPNRTTMNELKRRAIAIQGFITRTMDDRGLNTANTTASGSGGGSTPTSNGQAPTSAAVVDGASTKLEQTNGDAEKSSADDPQTTAASDGAEAEVSTPTPSNSSKVVIEDMSPQELKALSVEALLDRMKGQLTNFEQLLT